MPAYVQKQNTYVFFNCCVCCRDSYTLLICLDITECLICLGNSDLHKNKFLYIAPLLPALSNFLDLFIYLIKNRNMLKIKLEALEHPTPDKLDYNDRKVFASTILWLEDQKIRTYKIEDRENLRRVDNMQDWEEAYLQYKNDLGMPQFETPLEDISWLLSYAIRLEFLDVPDAYKDISSAQLAQTINKSITPSIKNENIFDNMDFNHKDFISGTRSLAAKLKVPNHPNHLIQLEAIARIIKERLSPAAKSRDPIVGTPFPFEKGNDVVYKDDPSLDYPVRILRLLQIQSLRELQTQINETIVSVQNLTANPKTDTKLGKVGR